MTNETPFLASGKRPVDNITKLTYIFFRRVRPPTFAEDYAGHVKIGDLGPISDVLFRSNLELQRLAFNRVVKFQASRTAVLQVIRELIRILWAAQDFLGVIISEHTHGL